MKRILQLTALALWLACAHGAMAQKKPEGLAKQLVGKWILEGMDFAFDSLKIGEAERAQYEMSKPMYAMWAELMAGKLTFDLKADGTFEGESREKEGEPERAKGTWKLEGNQLTMDAPDRGEGAKVFSMQFEKETHLLGMRKPEEPVIFVLKFKRS